jgi:hypothetical protein
MITFSKQNTTQAYVLRNYQRIGILETTLDGYLLSISYASPLFIPDYLKPYIKRIIEMEYNVSLRMQNIEHNSEKYYFELLQNSVPREERIYKE